MLPQSVNGIVPIQAAKPNIEIENMSSETDEIDVGRQFEQMLWAEMLAHAGLEKSLTLGGGEAASAFSRYVVEAIAKDIAEHHPLGFADSIEFDPSPTEDQR